jgi:predicted O-linked N-acetylglucosamine transferase (SPINDLY family)
LIAGLFEIHDRSRFEVMGISYGRDDGSEIRARTVRAFDRFYDISSDDDRRVAGLITELEVDIAIDLTGYANDKRTEILARRPAPIQVTYLGYPGTSGADFIDYIIADPIVLPFDQQPWYTEKIVHLPETYQVNDSTRSLLAAPGRAQAGLPDDGFVFCCFNNSWKINAPVFDIWMRLLRQVNGSVLWLLRPNRVVIDNLRKEARARGVDPVRLVFAPPLDLPEHLARHQLADLFLDTLPYNAHTTASDSLWAGVPIVTMLGKTFAGRVAASTLNAIGLSELVTRNLAQYEELALYLASDLPSLQSIRTKLAANRTTHPLFDSDRFRRHIEAAYSRMWEIWQRGESPRSFRVDPIETS